MQTKAFERKKVALIGLVMMFAVLACNVPLIGDEAIEPATEAVADAVPTLTLQSDASGVTETPASAGSVTNTPDAAAATSSPAAAVTSTSTCLFNGVYVSDITIPDGTEIVAGGNFTKTWRIKNNGCQTWPAGTVLAFKTGNQMGGPVSVPVPQTAPNGTQDISVNMVAPATPGEYSGGWKLRTPDGISFGDQITVVIKSVSPTATPAPAAPSATPTTGLIILPPPVLLITDFSISGWGGTFSCSGIGQTAFKITNSGATTLESMRADIDGPIGTHLNGFNNNIPFGNLPPDCSGTRSESLAAGATAWINVTVNPLPAGGTSGRVTLKFCTQNDLGGACATHTYDFNY